jgi:hypothetical protein
VGNASVTTVLASRSRITPAGVAAAMAAMGRHPRLSVRI